MRRARPLVLVVVGTRPEVVKLAPVVRALRARRGLRCRVIATGQHRGLLDQAAAAFGLRLDADLRLMRHDQDLNALLQAAVAGLRRVLARERPDLVVVQGDTTSALAGAVAAVEAGVPVAHVEAGLRTRDFLRPFPEELNRVLIDALAELRFAPTKLSARNLRAEGLPARGTFVVGNTAVDAALWAAARRRGARDAGLRRALAAARGKPLILATLHRRESLGPALAGACRALGEVLERRPDAHLILPVHPSPRVRRTVRAELRHPRARLVAPLDPVDLAQALAACRFVATDSGGLQEEAAIFGKPALVLREKTDRPEAVAAGVARVVGLDPRAIIRWGTRLLDDRALYRRMARRVRVFGDGRTGPRIARLIAERLGVR